MTNKISFFVLIAMCVFIAPLSAAELAGDADIVVVNARIISPPNVIERGFVEIRGGKITSVGSGAPPQSSLAHIDVGGKTLIPGMIDAHVHLIIGPTNDEEYERAVQTIGAAKLRGFLASGFTTIFSPGDYWPQILSVRERVDSGNLLGPRLLIAGPLITATNGHPTDVFPECVKNPYCRTHWAAQIDDPSAAKALVSDLAKHRVDAIKFAYTPEGEHLGAAIAPLSRPVAVAIIETAHKYHLPVAVYEGDTSHAMDALSLGADFLTHPVYDGKKGATSSGEFIPTDAFTSFSKSAAKAKMPMTTTASEAWPLRDYWGNLHMAHTGVPYREALMQYGVDIGQQTPDAYYKESLSLYPYLDRQGVPLIFGTGTFRLPAELSVELEFNALTQANFSPMKILSMATREAAAALKQNDIGVIAAGKRADLVLLSEDPRTDIAALKTVQWVMKGGKVVYRSPWPDALSKHP